MINPHYWRRHKIKIELSWIKKLWWKLMPGTIIKVKWPSGELIVDHNHPLWQDMGGAVWVNLGESSDPNHHYRPDMEKNVGRQGWDWDWCLTNNDINENRLTIKFRRGKEHWASYFALKWA